VSEPAQGASAHVGVVQDVGVGGAGSVAGGVVGGQEVAGGAQASGGACPGRDRLLAHRGVRAAAPGDLADRLGHRDGGDLDRVWALGGPGPGGLLRGEEHPGVSGEGVGQAVVVHQSLRGVQLGVEPSTPDDQVRVRHGGSCRGEQLAVGGGHDRGQVLGSGVTARRDASGGYALMALMAGAASWLWSVLAMGVRRARPRTSRLK